MLSHLAHQIFRLYRTTPVSYLTVLAYGGVRIYYFPSVRISYKVSMAQVPTPKLANQTHTPGESTDAQEHEILFLDLCLKKERLVAFQGTLWHTQGVICMRCEISGPSSHDLVSFYKTKYSFHALRIFQNKLLHSAKRGISFQIKIVNRRDIFKQLLAMFLFGCVP
jgi:hypothetical protein